MIQWIKKWGWALLVGTIGILVTILGIKYEREKIARLRRAAESERLKGAIAGDKARKEVAKGREEVLEKKDDALVERVAETKKSVAEERQTAKGRSPDEVVDDFNRRYGGSKRFK